MSMIYKDSMLNRLSWDGNNVAQFFSVGPNCEMRYNRILGHNPNYDFLSILEATTTLLDKSCTRSVSVRSFKPDSVQGNPFYYDLNNVEEVISIIENLTNEGYYVIINENIPIDDGGVNGVVYRDSIEFAPETTPRFVENGGELPIATLPRYIGEKLIECVYGCKLNLSYSYSKRTEFSVHPQPRGYKNEHVIIWEEHNIDGHHDAIQPYIVWPNSFSTFIGDKAYGLLITHLIGVNVPEATVYLRNSKVEPFRFGRNIPKSANYWTRTCPKVQEPGKYTTVKGWVDPYELMNKDDPEGENIVSCLVQQEVNAVWSGACITENDGNILIEGVSGFGDEFMVGDKKPEELPDELEQCIAILYDRIFQKLKQPIRFEWVHDGYNLWIVQLHVGKSTSCGRVIVNGDAEGWLTFEIEKGLEELRRLVRIAKIENLGITVKGNIGMTSHIADVLRKANIPAKCI